MSRYRAVLRLRPPRTVGWASPVLDSSAVARALGDGLVSCRTGTNDRGEFVLDVTLERESDQQLCDDLFTLAQRYGYILVAGEASRLVARTVDGVVTGALSGLLPGAAKNNLPAALVGSVAAGLAGWVVGSKIRHVEVSYRLERNRYGGWTLSPIPRPEPGRSAQPAAATA